MGLGLKELTEHYRNILITEMEFVGQRLQYYYNETKSEAYGRVEGTLVNNQNESF